MIRYQILTQTSKAWSHRVELNLTQMNVILISHWWKRVSTAQNISLFSRPPNMRWISLWADHVIRTIQCQSYWLQQNNTTLSNRATVDINNVTQLLNEKYGTKPVDTLCCKQCHTTLSCIGQSLIQCTSMPWLHVK